MALPQPHDGSRGGWHRFLRRKKEQVGGRGKKAKCAEGVCSPCASPELLSGSESPFAAPSAQGPALNGGSLRRAGLPGCVGGSLGRPKEPNTPCTNHPGLLAGSPGCAVCWLKQKIEQNGREEVLWACGKGSRDRTGPKEALQLCTAPGIKGMWCVVGVPWDTLRSNTQQKFFCLFCLGSCAIVP